MRTVFQNRTYPQMWDFITKIATQEGMELIAAFKQEPNFKSSMNPESAVYQKNLRQIEIDTHRTVMLLEGKNYADDYARPCQDAAAIIQYTQGDLTGSTSNILLTHSIVGEIFLYSKSFLFTYWNDAGQMCGLSLYITKSDIYDHENPKTYYKEPLQWSLAVARNTIQDRFPENPQDPQQPGYSLLVSENFPLEKKHSKRTNLDTIGSVIGSEKATSWVHLILASKNPKQLYGALALYEHLKCTIDLSDKQSIPSRADEYEDTTLEITGLCFDISCVNAIKDLSKHDRDLLADAAKYSRHPADNRCQQDHCPELFLCRIIARAKSAALRDLCKQRLPAMLGTQQDYRGFLNQTYEYICKSGKDSLISIEELAAILHAARPFEMNYEDPLHPVQQALYKQKIIFMLIQMIKLSSEYAVHCKDPDNTSRLKDAIEGITVTLTMLAKKNGWGKQAIRWHQFLNAAEPQESDIPIHANIKSALPDDGDFSVTSLQQALFKKTKSANQPPKDSPMMRFLSGSGASQTKMIAQATATKI